MDKQDNDNLTTIIEIPYGTVEVTEELLKSLMMEKSWGFSPVKFILPDTVETIEKFAFYMCTTLTSIEIPGSVKSIGVAAFKNCMELKKVKLDEGITELSPSMFDYCTSLEEITIPKSVKRIHNGAFRRCDSLKNIELPDNVDVSSFCFSGASSISINGIAFKKIGGEFSVNSPEHYSDERLRILLDEKKNNCKEIDFLNTYINRENIELSDILKLKINMETFSKNIEFLKVFSTKDEFLFSFLNENKEAFNSDLLKNIYDNYKYLESQNIIDSKNLKKIYFNFDFDSFEDFYNKIVKDSYKVDFDLISTLMNKPSDEIRLDLRDRLVLSATLKYLNGDLTKSDVDEVKIFLKKNVFNNLVELDHRLYVEKYKHKKENKLFEDPTSKEYFDGITYHLTKELYDINPEIIDALSTFNDPKKRVNFGNLVKSLNVVRNWDNYSDKKQRATILKNEVVGRSLYAIFNSNLRNNEDFNKLFNENKYDEIETLINDFDIDYSLVTKEFLRFFSNIDFNNYFILSPDDRISKAIIKRLIRENPYVFDMLRGKNEISDEFYKEALINGYLFEGEEFDKAFNTLNKKEQSKYLSEANIVDTIAKSILNDIGLSKIPKEEEERYLNNVNLLVNNYFASRKVGENELFALFRSVDVYLRKNKEYEVQRLINPDTDLLSKEIFDLDNDNYNNNDRLCYCLFNLNKLAHQINSVNTRVIDIDINRYKSLAEKQDNQKNMKSALNGYNELQKYGLSVELINLGILNSKGINDAIEKKDYNKLRAGLEFFVQGDYSNEKEFDSSTDYEMIATYINNIKQLDDNIKNQILIDSKEQRIFYKTKSIIAKEYLLKLSEFVATKVSSEKSSVEFFKKNGFLVECQENSTGKLLVVYNPKFEEPFSIHLADLSDSLAKEFASLKTDDPLIAYKKVDGGLRKRTNSSRKNNISNVESGYLKGVDDVPIKLSNFFRLDVFLIEEEINKFLMLDNIDIEMLNSFMDDIMNKLPINDGIKFFGDSKSIVKKYKEMIGFDRLLVLKEKIISDKSSMSIDMDDDLVEKIAHKK